MAKLTARAAFIAPVRTSSFASAAITTAGSGSRVRAGSSRMKPAAACLASGRRSRPCREYVLRQQPAHRGERRRGLARWVARPELGLDEVAHQGVEVEALVEGCIRLGGDVAQVHLDLVQGDLVAGLGLGPYGVAVQHADGRVVDVPQSVLRSRATPLDALLGQRQERGDVHVLALRPCVSSEVPGRLRGR